MQLNMSGKVSRASLSPKKKKKSGSIGPMLIELRFEESTYYQGEF